MESGISLITKERKRQTLFLGYDPKNDDQYSKSELLLAAASYILYPVMHITIPESKIPFIWPWSKILWRPCKNNRIKELTKAGALIAAEIDRLQRIEELNLKSKQDD